MKNIVLLVGLFLALTEVAFASPFMGGVGLSTSNTETITASLSSTTTVIPANFVGFSIEIRDVTDAGLLQSPTESLHGILSLIGPNGVYRIGANSQDSPSYTCTEPPVVTTTIANNVASFFSTLGPGWTVSWGLDLKNENPTPSVTYAGIMATAFSSVSNPLVFSIGNEPDFYGWSQATYDSEWNSYYSALTAAYPSIRFEAGEYGEMGDTTWLSGLTPAASSFVFTSSHSYMGGTETNYSGIIAAAAGLNFSSEAANGNYRLDECGIEYEEGSNGTGNAELAAAWYINIAMRVFLTGGLGLNPHSALTQDSLNCSNFGPVNWNDFVLQGDGNYKPAPRFYGELLFSKIEGQATIPATITGSGNVKALATKGTNGNANILVVNNDVNNPVNIKPAQSASWTTADVLVLAPDSGAGCGGENPTLGGAPIGESGSWTGAPFSLSNGGAFELQLCGAALVNIQP